MAKRTFKGYAPAEIQTIELESPDGVRRIEVKAKPAVAGSVILDFLSDTDSDDPGTLAKAVMKMLQFSLAEEDWDVFKAFIDDEANGITLEVLAEIAGFLAESFSGKAQAPQELSTAS